MALISANIPMSKGSWLFTGVPNRFSTHTYRVMLGETPFGIEMLGDKKWIKGVKKYAHCPEFKRKILGRAIDISKADIRRAQFSSAIIKEVIVWAQLVKSIFDLAKNTMEILKHKWIG